MLTFISQILCVISVKVIILKKKGITNTSFTSFACFTMVIFFRLNRTKLNVSVCLLQWIIEIRIQSLIKLMCFLRSYTTDENANGNMQKRQQFYQRADNCRISFMDNKSSETSSPKVDGKTY